MNRNIIETIMGAIVLVIAGGFLFFAFKSGNVQQAEGYALKAKFDRVDGLVVGADVRVSGIKVGAVTAQNIDPASYQAVVTFVVKDEVKIPRDSSAEIIGDGLLGSKYLALIPGGEPEALAAGDEVRYTQSSISIEALIGKFIYGGADDKKKAPAKAAEGELGAPEQKNANVPSL